MSSELSQNKNLNKSYLVCFSCALFFFYEFIQMQMFSAINDVLRGDFAVNATKLSFLSSTYLWGDLLFLLPAGLILDRYSTRMTVIYTMLLSIVSTLGFAMTSNFWLAAFFHFLTGIGNAFCFLACVILVARWFPSNKQAMVIGMVVTIALLGGMCAQTPLAKITQAYGWRKALWIDAILGCVILLQIYRFVEDSPSAYKYRHNIANSSLLMELWQVLKNLQNYFAGIYTSLLNLPIMVWGALWGVESLKVIHNVDTMEASYIISMIFIGSIVGCPIAGWLSDNWGVRRRPMIIGAILSLLAVMVMLLPVKLGISTLCVIFFFIGFFTSTQVIAYPMVAESNTPSLTATATALASILIMGGGGVGQLLFGSLLDMHWQGTMNAGQRIYAAGDFHFAMLLFPASFILALLAAICSRETYGRPAKHLYK